MGLNIAMLSIHSSPIGDLGTQNTGGMSVYVRETAKELGKMGHHVDVFTQHHAGNHESVFYLYENVRLIRLSGGTRQNIAKTALYDVLPKLSGELELFRIEENMSYNIVHSHYWISGILGLMRNAAWNAFHVITYHTLGAVKNVSCPMEDASELRLADEKKLAKHCDRIIVPTQKDKDYLIQYYHATGDNIRIVPCGVNLDRFKPQDKISARRQLKLPINDPMILYVGRFAPIKGLDRLLESIRRITRLTRSVLVLVGGDGERSIMAQQIKNDAMAMNIRDRLIFAGRVDQEILPLYYNAADVLVVPSYYESFGLVALEALACGTPVVTAAVGAMEQIVKDGVTGYVVSDSDPRHFSDCIEAVLEKQNRFSSSKIRASVSEFTWARSASLLLDAYQSVSADKERCNSICQTNTK